MNASAERLLAVKAAENARGLAEQAAEEERERIAEDVRERRAPSGNLAIFALAQIWNDLAAYEKQFVMPARKSTAPWLLLQPSTISDQSYYSFDVSGLASFCR